MVAVAATNAVDELNSCVTPNATEGPTLMQNLIYVKIWEKKS